MVDQSSVEAGRDLLLESGRWGLSSSKYVIRWSSFA